MVLLLLRGAGWHQVSRSRDLHKINPPVRVWKAPEKGNGIRLVFGHPNFISGKVNGIFLCGRI